MLHHPKSTLRKTLVTVSALALFGSLPACGGAPEDTTAPSLEIGTSSQAVHAGPVLPSPTLVVPEGNRLAFHYDAVGVQIYACSATATGGYAWVFQAPEATLYGHHGRIEGKHYVGPTWESIDGSKVTGTKLAAFSADATAIPELLLQAATHALSGRMEDVTYIQRLDTVGGLAPSAGCDATAVGTTARVDYTATYYFYEAKRLHAKCDDDADD